MTNAERSSGGVSRKAKRGGEAPVNVGRNYNGPKVAKFLVGQVPTCTNRVTIWALSHLHESCNDLGAVSTWIPAKL